MLVQRLVFRIEWGVPNGPEGSDIGVRVALPDRDAAFITAVTDACRGGAGPSPAACGMRGELSGRSDRRVTTWLAFAEDRPVGLLVGVAAGVAPRVRHSIAWLLVIPDARRRGVATALAGAAVHAAIRAGAREVWAETRTDWPAAISFWTAVGFRPMA